jgi:hypothetical protein
MGQAGFLDHDDTVHGIRMFAREVYPRLKDIFPDIMASGTVEKSNSVANRQHASANRADGKHA